MGDPFATAWTIHWVYIALPLKMRFTWPERTLFLIFPCNSHHVRQAHWLTGYVVIFTLLFQTCIREKSYSALSHPWTLLQMFFLTIVPRVLCCLVIVVINTPVSLLGISVLEVAYAYIITMSFFCLKLALAFSFEKGCKYMLHSCLEPQDRCCVRHGQCSSGGAFIETIQTWPPHFPFSGYG